MKDVKKTKKPTVTQKRAAYKVLGLRDDMENIIQFDERSREALLISIEVMQESAEATRAGHQKQKDNLLAKIKAHKTAKSKANQRADLAEAKLKKILSALAEFEQ